ncbi:DUF732 domain-containing protein [Mycolicibacterium madagascariense]|nr:DUF732 domain-containing protein [Mycolicibacterium madagascariense]MCV7012373.1 DUF732 domain-containing protein [Mycolicibacterium madagascariense]
MGTVIVVPAVTVGSPAVAKASPGNCYDAVTPDCVRPGTDVNGFFDYLERNGDSVDTADLRNASLDMGWAICNEFDVGMTNQQVGRDLMRHNHSASDAAAWVVGSVTYMCPEYSDSIG